MKKIRNNFKNLVYIIYIVLLITIFINISNSSAESFDTNITIKPSLTLDISANKISMNLDPASKPYDEQELTTTVGTNNSNGYKLYLSTNSGSTSLTNIADSTKTIPTLPSDTPSSGYTITTMPANYWGYKLNNSTGYLPFTNNLVVSSSTTPVNSNAATLGFASKIDYTMPSGTYELTLNFKALPIVTQYYMQDLGKDSELASRVCTTDPTVVIDSRDEQAYMIRRLPDGRCWMLDNLNLDLTNKDIAEGLNSTNTNADDTTLNYLRSGGRAYGDQYPTAGLTYENWGSTPTSSYSQPFVNIEGSCDSVYSSSNIYPCTYTGTYTKDTILSTLTPNQSFFGEGYGKIGVHYNYCAASAGSYCYDASGSKAPPAGTNATADICPVGWRLPTGGPSGEFQSLCSSITGASCSNPTDMDGAKETSMQYLLSTPLSGAYAGEGRRQGYNGNFWSSTYQDSPSMFRLYIMSSSVYPQDVMGRFNGDSIRCILSE